jgi:hypothetical protein
MGKRSDRRALSVRQPYAEQILRGTKQFEYRSVPTNIRERIYIYASLTPGSDEDFAQMHARPGDFPAGVLIGTVEVVDCEGKAGDYRWHLSKPERLPKPIKPDNHPQPVWFYPFKEKSADSKD